GWHRGPGAHRSEPHFRVLTGRLLQCCHGGFCGCRHSLRHVECPASLPPRPARSCSSAAVFIGRPDVLVHPEDLHVLAGLSHVSGFASWLAAVLPSAAAVVLWVGLSARGRFRGCRPGGQRATRWPTFSYLSHPSQPTCRPVAN